MAKDAVCFVPSKALLALFKVKARRDRLYDIRTKGATMNPARLAWLRGKVAKDGSDIIALLDPKERGVILEDEMDYAQVSALASGFGIRDLVRGALEQDSLGLPGPIQVHSREQKRSETHRPIIQSRSTLQSSGVAQPTRPVTSASTRSTTTEGSCASHTSASSCSTPHATRTRGESRDLPTLSRFMQEIQ